MTQPRPAGQPAPPVAISAAARYLEPRAAALLLAFFFLYLINSFGRDFWAPEEPDFAAAAQEMSRSGNWMVPLAAGEPYLEKPPLIYWLGLASRAMTRLDPHIAYRLPVALFAVLGLWATYLAGRRFFNEAVGIGALLIHGTSLWFFQNASSYLTDMPFASAIGLSVVAYAMAIYRDPRTAHWKWVGHASLAVACLAKSPFLGVFLIAAPVLAWLLFYYRLNISIIHDIRKLRPLAGLILVLVIVSPWYVYMIFKFGSLFIRENILEHQFGRLSDADSHQQPPWYYLANLPVGFLPWSLFFPLILFYCHNHFRRLEVKFLVLWMLVTFISLTLISSKQGKYLLPMFTPLSIAAAASILEGRQESIWEGYLMQAVFRTVPWILKAFSCAAAVAALVLASGMAASIGSWTGVDFSAPRYEPLQQLLDSLVFRIEGACLAAGLAAVFWLAGGRIHLLLQRRELVRCVSWFAGACAAGYLAWSVLSWDFDGLKSSRAFSDKLARLAAGKTVAIYGTLRNGIVYYYDGPLKLFQAADPTGQTGVSEKPLEDFVRGPGEVLIVASDASRRLLESDYPKFKLLLHGVDSGLAGSHRLYWILSNRPQEAGPPAPPVPGNGG